MHLFRPSLTQPLTPERFLRKRRHFFWLVSLCNAFFAPTFVIYTSPAMSRENSQLLALFVGLIAFVGGWLGAWFLWQWYGEALKVNEKARLLRERAHEV